jgi:hypothetical protein
MYRFVFLPENQFLFSSINFHPTKNANRKKEEEETEEFPLLHPPTAHPWHASSASRGRRPVRTA